LSKRERLKKKLGSLGKGQGNVKKKKKKTEPLSPPWGGGREGPKRVSRWKKGQEKIGRATRKKYMQEREVTFQSQKRGTGPLL